MPINPRRRRLLRAMALLAVAISLGLGAGETTAVGSRHRGLPDRGILPEPRSETSAQDVMALLQEDHRRSIDRALAELDAHFIAWREGVPRFAEGLLGWTTRARLAWSGLTGVVGGGSDRSQIVRERFEREVIREGELRTAIERAIERFVLEMRADRARALARVRARVRWSELEAMGVDRASLAHGLAAVESRLERALLRQADRSIAAGVASVVGAVVVTEIVVSAVGASMGGAAAGGAVAGAVGGSWAPGVGTLVGFTAGLGAGIAVDWWMHARTRDEVVRRCEEALMRLRIEIVEGPASGERPGLRALFAEAARLEAETLRREIESVLEGVVR